jgi:hypothetical protein
MKTLYRKEIKLNYYNINKFHDKNSLQKNIIQYKTYIKLTEFEYFIIKKV